MGNKYGDTYLDGVSEKEIVYLRKSFGVSDNTEYFRDRLHEVCRGLDKSDILNADFASALFFLSLTEGVKLDEQSEMLIKSIRTRIQSFSKPDGSRGHTIMVGDIQITLTRKEKEMFDKLSNSEENSVDIPHGSTQYTHFRNLLKKLGEYPEIAETLKRRKNPDKRFRNGNPIKYFDGGSQKELGLELFLVGERKVLGFINKIIKIGEKEIELTGGEYELLTTLISADDSSVEIKNPSSTYHQYLSLLKKLGEYPEISETLKRRRKFTDKGFGKGKQIKYSDDPKELGWGLIWVGSGKYKNEIIKIRDTEIKLTGGEYELLTTLISADDNSVEIEHPGGKYPQYSSLKKMFRNYPEIVVSLKNKVKLIYNKGFSSDKGILPNEKIVFLIHCYTFTEEGNNRYSVSTGEESLGDIELTDSEIKTIQSLRIINQHINNKLKGIGLQLVRTDGIVNLTSIKT